MDRVLETMGSAIVYTDCDYTQDKVVTVRGKMDVRRWLLPRFKEGDSLGQARIITDNPGRPNVAVVQAARTSALLRANHLLPLATGVKFVLRGPTYNHVSQGAISAPGAHCGA